MRLNTSSTPDASAVLKAFSAQSASRPDAQASHAENALSGKYPLSRYLYVNVNKHPNEPLAPREGEFLRMVLSQTGQTIVVKDGYIPLPAKIVDKALGLFGSK